MKRGIVRRIEKNEKIIFAEVPGLAGILVYRSPSERNSNPERLNLDRRDLTQMPLLEGEERLRLLNYQHNFISKIDNLSSLPNLIFLDLYNNQVKEINGLNTVPSLRVLMLGKNLIEKIKNLNALTKLDVLDLHSNKISKIESISHLKELRVLNLANNQITIVENLEGIKALTEVNLRRNLIEQVKSLNLLENLQRVFLSNNKIEKFDNIECLGQCNALTELALDGNPIQFLTNYLAWVLQNCLKLLHFDLKKVTPNMKENLNKSQNSLEITTVSSEVLINTIRQEWEAEIYRIKSKGLNYFSARKETPLECLVKSGHGEIEGDSMLFVYGNALEIITKPEFQETVTSISFHYLRFDHIIQNSAIVRYKKFQHLKKLIFSENNLTSYIQLSKFESLQSLNSISIEKNDIVNTTLYRSFIVYRFPNIIEINDFKVDEDDKIKAKHQYQVFDKMLCTPSIFVRNT
jgi:leucine-rich repeat-containing protein 49